MSWLYQPLPNTPSPTAVTETPIPGGALVAGLAPSSHTSVSVGGAVGAGSSPSFSAGTPVGGAVATGQPVTATSTVAAGEIFAGGLEPSAKSTLPAGGVTATGNAPTEVVSSITGTRGSLALSMPAEATLTLRDKL